MSKGRLVEIGFIIFTLFFVGGSSLRDVRISIPTAVEIGHRAVLSCQYNLEGEALYTVKWYKAEREFFRYIPKEAPPIKQFPISGLRVLERDSNATHVILEDVKVENSGTYSCEISADAPSFFTVMKTSHLQVVRSPEHDPVISGLKHRYRPNDTLKADCKSKDSIPSTNLTWFVNGKDVEPIHIRHHRPHVDYRNFSTSHSGLRIKVTKDMFHNNRLKIRCVANLYNVYHRSSEISVEQERQKWRHHATTTTTVNPDAVGDQSNSIDSYHTLMFAPPAEMSSECGPLLRLENVALATVLFALMR